MVPFLCGKSCGKREKTRPPKRTYSRQLLWDSQTSAIRFEVTDNGKGVTEAQAHALFRDQGVARIIQKSGNGIGLQAVKTYVAGLGGTVGAERSTFWFRIPIIQTPTKMHPIFLTFQGAEETSFRKYYMPSPVMFITSYGMFSILNFILVALIFQEFSERYYCYYRAVNGPRSHI